MLFNDLKKLDKKNPTHTNICCFVALLPSFSSFNSFIYFFLFLSLILVSLRSKVIYVYITCIIRLTVLVLMHLFFNFQISTLNHFEVNEIGKKYLQVYLDYYNLNNLKKKYC